MEGTAVAGSWTYFAAICAACSGLSCTPVCVCFPLSLSLSLCVCACVLALIMYIDLAIPMYIPLRCSSRAPHSKLFAGGEMLLHRNAPTDAVSMKVHGERYVKLESEATKRVNQIRQASEKEVPM